MAMKSLSSKGLTNKSNLGVKKPAIGNKLTVNSSNGTRIITPKNLKPTQEEDENLKDFEEEEEINSEELVENNEDFFNNEEENVPEEEVETQEEEIEEDKQLVEEEPVEEDEEEKPVKKTTQSKTVKSNTKTAKKAKTKKEEPVEEEEEDDPSLEYIRSVVNNGKKLNSPLGGKQRVNNVVKERRYYKNATKIEVYKTITKELYKSGLIPENNNPLLEDILKIGNVFENVLEDFINKGIGFKFAGQNFIPKMEKAVIRKAPNAPHPTLVMPHIKISFVGRSSDFGTVYGNKVDDDNKNLFEDLDGNIYDIDEMNRLYEEEHTFSTERELYSRE